MSFEKIIGNEENKILLNNIIKNNNISHSYLFYGIDGIGKSLFAREFAKMILCLNSSENKPCNECKSCLQFNSDNNPDYYEIGLEENSIKIDKIRQMQKKALEKPIISDKKVYIINDSDYMTKEAQNCLLKTLEEPPKYLTIILIASNESKLLNTIKSRCIKISFKNIENNILKDYIHNNLGIKELPSNILKASLGSIGKSIKILDKKDIYKNIDDIFSNLENYTLLDIINNIGQLFKDKDEIYNILDYINIIFFEKAKQNCKYVDYIKCVEETKNNLKNNCNYDMCIDNLLYNIWDK